MEFRPCRKALPECQNPQNHPPKRMIFSVSHRRFFAAERAGGHYRERITSGTPFGTFGAFCPEEADGSRGGGRRGTNANQGAAARQTKTNRCRDRPQLPDREQQQTGGNPQPRQQDDERPWPTVSVNESAPGGKRERSVQATQAVRSKRQAAETGKSCRGRRLRQAQTAEAYASIARTQCRQPGIDKTTILNIT